MHPPDGVTTKNYCAVGIAGVIGYTTITFRGLYLSRATYATQNPLQVYLMHAIYDYPFVGIKEKIIAYRTAVLHAIRDDEPEHAFGTMRRRIDCVPDFFTHPPRLGSPLTRSKCNYS